MAEGQKEIEEFTVLLDNVHRNKNIESAIRIHDLGWLRNLSICFPASVVSYDRQTHKAEVQPLIKQGYYNKEWKYINRGTIMVSVRAIQHGGFTFDVPVFTGDTGWVFASDRDTALLKQEGALTNSVLSESRKWEIVNDSYSQIPNTMATHDLTHGVFIPDNWGTWEMGRFKDSIGVNIGSSLYIGQSIDTQDPEEISESGFTNADDAEKVKKSLQDGKGYENDNSSSLVVDRHGPIHLLSSSPKEDLLTSRVSVDKSSVDFEVFDRDIGMTVSSYLDAANGISVSQMHSMREFFTAEVDAKGLVTVRSKNMSITVMGGNVTIESEGDLNLNTKGFVDVESQKGTTITASEVKAVIENDCAVETDGTAYIMSNANIGIHSTGFMEMEVAGDITMYAAGDTTVAFSCGGSLSVNTTELEFDEFSPKTMTVSGEKYGDIVLDAEQVELKETYPKYREPEIEYDENGVRVVKMKELETPVTAENFIKIGPVSMEIRNNSEVGSITIDSSLNNMSGNVSINGDRITIYGYEEGLCRITYDPNVLDKAILRYGDD